MLLKGISCSWQLRLACRAHNDGLKIASTVRDSSIVVGIGLRSLNCEESESGSKLLLCLCLGAGWVVTRLTPINHLPSQTVALLLERERILALILFLCFAFLLWAVRDIALNACA
jgi:hypothetical protein